MSQYKEHLEQLKNLDLKTCTTKELRELVGTIGALPIITTTYYKNKIIERAVNIEAGVLDFTTTERISFKPAHLNKEYARASTPDNTMFYGVPVDENSYDEDGRFTGLDYSRITGGCEINELLKDPEIKSGEAIIIVGMWKVKDELNLVTVFNPDKDYGVPYINEVKNHLKNELEKIENPILKEKGLNYYRTLGYEFGKDVDVRPHMKQQYQYKISAEFSRQTTQDYDGIIYPSVRADGIGICVAIKPESTSKIELIEVNKISLVKKDGKVNMKYVGRCDVTPPARTYQILPIDEYRNSKT